MYSQALHGNCVVSSIKNSPWRGTYDAIVTDPPYSIRTALLEKSISTNINIDSNTTTDSRNMKSIVTENEILFDLISFASSHLKSQGRLVFWWPDGMNFKTLNVM